MKTGKCDVRRAAVVELARGWHDDPDTLPILKRRAESGKNWDVRRAAVEEIARGWHYERVKIAIIRANIANIRAKEIKNIK